MNDVRKCEPDWQTDFNETAIKAPVYAFAYQ